MYHKIIKNNKATKNRKSNKENQKIKPGGNDYVKERNGKKEDGKQWE